MTGHLTIQLIRETATEVDSVNSDACPGLQARVRPADPQRWRAGAHGATDSDCLSLSQRSGRRLREESDLHSWYAPRSHQNKGFGVWLLPLEHLGDQFLAFDH
jgi:hypothetical protein